MEHCVKDIPGQANKGTQSRRELLIQNIIIALHVVHWFATKHESRQDIRSTHSFYIIDGLWLILSDLCHTK